MRAVEEYEGEVSDAYSKRPSRKSVLEVLDIIQQQHSPRLSSTLGSNVTNSKGKAPLPAIKASTSSGRGRGKSSSDGKPWDDSSSVHSEGLRFSTMHGELPSSTERLYIDGQNTTLINGTRGNSGIHAESLTSPLQRETTFQQLPPLSMKHENPSTRRQPDRTREENSRHMCSRNDELAESRIQARPSTGYGRRIRTASLSDEVDSSSLTKLCNDSNNFDAEVRRFNNTYSSSSSSSERPRTGYGRRSHFGNEVPINVDNHGLKTRANAELYSSASKSDLTPRSTAKKFNILGSNNTHRPIHASRSNEFEHRRSSRNIARDDAENPTSITTANRPKSSKGRCRRPAAPTPCRPESGFGDDISDMDIMRPSAPTPPSPCIDCSDNEAVFGESFPPNHTSRIQTL